MEKYRTAGHLIILRPCPAAGRLVTSLQERQRHRVYNSCLLLCVDNSLDHSFARKLLSTGRKPQLTLRPIKQGWQTSFKKIDV